MVVNSQKVYSTTCGDCDHDIKQGIPIKSSQPSPKTIMIECSKCEHINKATPKQNEVAYTDNNS